MTDPQLPLPGLVEPTYATAMSLAERFAEFDRLNPHIYSRLVAMTRNYAAAGQRASIGRFFEVLRHEAIQTRGEVYKLNNSYRAFYVRKIAAEYPDLGDLFERRTSQADRSAA